MTISAEADLQRHRQTWVGFCRFMKIMIAAIIVILVGMAIFLL
jgi:hypothetical protein